MVGLGELLGSKLKEQKSKTETQGLEPGTISSYFTFGSYRFKIRVTKVLIETRDISSASIWDNPTYGTWDDGHLWDAAKGSYSTTEEIILTQTIPTIAREIIADWLTGSNRDNPNYIALGTASTSYSDSDTSLYNQIAKKTITYDISDSKKVDYIVEILSSDTEFHSNTFREIGLFSTSEELFTRAVAPSFTASSGTDVKITISHDLEDDSIGQSKMTTSGMNLTRNWLGGNSPTTITHYAIGTGSDTISKNDTELANQTLIKTVSSKSTSDNTAVFESIVTRNQAIGETITRSGLYNGTTGSDLFCQTKFGGINKSNLFQIYQTDRIKIV